jgi:hypothetical protein
MPRLHYGDGNCYIITWIDDQFQPGIVVTVGQMKWRIVLLMSFHTEQSLRFIRLLKAIRYTILPARRPFRLAKKAVFT